MDLTHLVFDLNPGKAGSDPAALTAVGRLFFSANDGVHGRELWTSDGTRAGTKLVRNIRRGSSNPEQLTNLRGTLLFSATDGVHGVEPWVSDGTRAGTALLSDVNSHGDSLPRYFVRLGHRLLFAGNDGLHGREPMAVAFG